MATKEQIINTYDYMDDVFRLTFGECADCSCAMYNSDYSMTLEEAQQNKHDFIFRALNLKRDFRILDIGCGWGPMLRSAKNRNGTGVGLTLSIKQAESNLRNGFEVYIKDWKNVKSNELGVFDGIVCIGAFEHFCSDGEYNAGEQDAIYKHFFKFCHKHLKPSGKLFLQTTIWGPNVPNYKKVSLDAEPDSNEFLVAMQKEFYPGSWLPYSEEQIEKTATPYFKIESRNNGRTDYIETLDQWDRRIKTLNFRKALAMLRLVPKYLKEKRFRLQMESLFSKGGYMKLCLARNVMDHQRLVLKKV